MRARLMNNARSEMDVKHELQSIDAHHAYENSNFLSASHTSASSQSNHLIESKSGRAHPAAAA